MSNVEKMRQGMSDLNEEIVRLKDEGISFRRIAAALGVSHVAVLKRWRVIQKGNKVVTNRIRDGLPQLVKEERNLPTRSNPHTPKFSEDSAKCGNRLVTKELPSLGRGKNGNPSGTPFLRSPDEPGVVSDRFDDLFYAIKEFLESAGIEVYRRQSVPECYQVRHRDQVIRFYVERRAEVISPL